MPDYSTLNDEITILKNKIDGLTSQTLTAESIMYVAESLTKQLLETGSLTFGGINSEDMRTSGSSSKSKKKKNMRRVNMNASRKR